MELWITNQKLSSRVLIVVALWCVVCPFVCKKSEVRGQKSESVICPLSSAISNVSQHPVSKSKKKGIIKIATIGPRPLNVDANTKPQQVVKKMIAHWRGRFAQVLPDKPDLIVVPEACDRPAGFGLDKRLEYYNPMKGCLQPCSLI